MTAATVSKIADSASPDMSHGQEPRTASLTPSTSFRHACNMLVRAVSLLVLGYLLIFHSGSSPSKLSTLFGVFLTSIAFYGFDAIWGDASGGVFSPSARMNRFLAVALGRLSAVFLVTAGTLATLVYHYYLATRCPPPMPESWRDTQLPPRSWTHDDSLGMTKSKTADHDQHQEEQKFGSFSWTTVVFCLNYLAVPYFLLRLHKLAHEERESAVDRYAPGLARKLEKWARVLEQATRPPDEDQMSGGIICAGGGTTPSSCSTTSTTMVSSGTTTIRYGLPFARNRLAEIPIYKVKEWMEALEQDFHHLKTYAAAVSSGVGCTTKSPAVDVETESPVLVPKSSLPTLGDLSPVFADASLLFHRATILISEKPTAFTKKTAATEKQGSLENENLIGTSRWVQRKAAAAKVVRFLLAPIQVGFQKVFISSSDLQFYSVLAAFFALVYVGSLYFAYTPLAILFTLLAPRTAGPKWLEKKFAELEKTVLACQQLPEDRLVPGDGGAILLEKNTAVNTSSGLYLFGHKLNVFNCFYLGVNHLLALHAIFILLFAGGKDVVFEFFDAHLVAPMLKAVTGGGGGHGEWSHEFLPVKWGTLLFAVALWPVSCQGITAGVHRLWAHRSYEATPLLRALLMLLNSIANQGTIFHWARDHRVHHRFSDRDADPHDSRRGWFFSHVGWLLVEKTEQTKQAGRKIDVADLLSDRFVMFQKYTDPWWNFAWCFAFPAFCSLYCFGDTLWNGFLFAGVLRYVFVLHCTWAVNSIVHSAWGGPSVYDENEPPAESRLVAFLSCGEGWHSWHHAFAFDYAAAELGCWEQWNPTKAFIDGCWWLGLVGNRKRGLRMWAGRKEKMAEKARERGEELVETLKGPPLFKVRGLKTIENKALVVAG